MSRIKRIGRLVLFYVLVFTLFLFGTMLGSRTVTVIADTAPVIRSKCIVIDAGHGGEDGGAASCTQKAESEYNLEIALRLDDLFHLLGYSTCMIRKSDTAVYRNGDSLAQKKVSDLKERVRIANSMTGGILVSIHQNQFSDSRYSGAQVFYARSAGSKELADCVQSVFVATLNPGSRREIKQGNGIYLLEKVQIPGILVECGFLSNPEEEAKLRSEEYQKKICEVIAAGVCGWLSGT